MLEFMQRMESYFKCVSSVSMITMSAADAGLFLDQSCDFFKLLVVNISITI